VQLFGDAVDIDSHGEMIHGDTVLILFNADHASTIPFHLPPANGGSEKWKLEFDTACDTPRGETSFAAGEAYALRPCATAVFVAPSESKEAALDLDKSVPLGA
jgi:hypothetical protein